MTKTAVDYNTNNSVIYRIKCKNGSCIYTYTGATTNFIQRKASHKSTCNNANNKGYNALVYQTIRANGGWNNWEMVIVELFPCDSKQHLCVREQWHIEQQDNKINHNRAFTTDDVYTAGRNAYKKLYNDSYRDEINAYNKVYYDANRDEINAQSRKYREAHREELNAKMTKYREANREMINEQKKVYRQNDINTYKAREKAYREANKAIITAKQQAKRLAEKESQPQ